MKRFAATICVVILAAAGPVFADDGYTSPMVIPGAAFHTDGEDPDGFSFNVNGYIAGTGSPIMLFASVYLPDGATIDRMTLYAVDNSDSCTEQTSVEVVLNRAEIGDNGLYQMGLVETSGSSTGMQSPSDSSIGPNPVNNMLYRYYVRAMLCSSTHNLYAVSIEYSE